MGLHDDHRKRVRSLYLEEGSDALDDVHLLELYLFYSNPRIDVNPLAVRLLNHFGSLDGVFSADIPALCAVDGVGENTAVLLSLLKPLYRRSALSAGNSDQIVQSIDDAREYLAPYFFGLTQEIVYLLCLTASGRVLRCVQLGNGSVSSAQFSSEDAVRNAVIAKASCVILAHNHANGKADPSDADIIATGIIAAELKKADIVLLDHLIFAEDSSLSLRERGYYLPPYL